MFEGMKVYERVPRAEQYKTGGKIIGTKWIVVNKGDIDKPNIRCRLAGKEFRTTPDDAPYASTPPLEALRLIVSRAGTWDNAGCEREIMINDVSRAYFYAENQVHVHRDSCRGPIARSQHVGPIEVMLVWNPGCRIELAKRA